MTRRGWLGMVVGAAMFGAGWCGQKSKRASFGHGRFVDFGQGSLVMLHGKERIMTEAEASHLVANDRVVLAVDRLQRHFNDLPDLMVKALRESRGRT